MQRLYSIRLDGHGNNVPSVPDRFERSQFILLQIVLSWFIQQLFIYTMATFHRFILVSVWALNAIWITLSRGVNRSTEPHLCQGCSGLWLRFPLHEAQHNGKSRYYGTLQRGWRHRATVNENAAISERCCVLLLSYSSRRYLNVPNESDIPSDQWRLFAASVGNGRDIQAKPILIGWILACRFYLRETRNIQPLG